MTRSETLRFWLLVGGAAAAIAVGCWLASGTVAPYATWDYNECHYRVNGDHLHFKAVYLMIDGRPHSAWDQSVVLRRILHPLLAFPLMKWLGFWVGGVVFNMVLHAASVIALGLAIRRYFDARAAVLVCWLFASFPGYAYWAGLPYSYAFIVPGSVFCTIGLLWWHDRPSLARTAIAASIVGIATLGYDLMPFFGGALLLLNLFKRRWLDLVVALVVLAAWGVFIGRGLPAIFGFPVVNGNTQIYGVITNSWLHFWERTDGWGELLLDSPRVFVSNFFFSGHIFLPFLFLLVVAHNVRYRVRPILGPISLAILIATFGVWAFFNFAPPYKDFWQIRGTWIPRLYQPWFVVVLLLVAAASINLRDTARYKWLVRTVVAICIAGWFALAGPYFRVFFVYMATHQSFYQHKEHAKNWKYMHKHGVRPLGFCKP